MGINSKAIEKIDEQIRMLDEDYKYNSVDTTDDSFISEDESTTMKIDSISELDDVEVLDESSDIVDTNKIEPLEEDEGNNEINIQEESSEELVETDDGYNVFLIYYIGIILIAIVLLVIIYFLFK